METGNESWPFNPLTTFGRTRNMKINLELGVPDEDNEWQFDLNAIGDAYVPIIEVNDILALSDIINNVGLPINDCHQYDMLPDGELNIFDIVILENLIMNGDN